jgi:hypothetical protein
MADAAWKWRCDGISCAVQGLAIAHIPKNKSWRRMNSGGR